MSIWDDPNLQNDESEFVKLDAVGDKFSGPITGLKLHKFDDDSVAPQVTFVCDRTGDTKTWTAGQMQAKAKLKERAAAQGDWFSAELTQIEKRGGGRTLKHIDVVIRRGGKNGPVVNPGDPGTPGYKPEDVPAIAGHNSPGQAPAAVDGPPPGTGVDPAIWATLPQSAKDSILASAGK